MVKLLEESFLSNFFPTKLKKKFHNQLELHSVPIKSNSHLTNRIRIISIVSRLVSINSIRFLHNL